MPQVLTISAQDIHVLLKAKRHGSLEMELLHHAANAKKVNDGRPLFLRVDFPQEGGGIEIRCKRGWLTSILWRLRREARMW